MGVILGPWEVVWTESRASKRTKFIEKIQNYFILFLELKKNAFGP